MTEKLFYEDPFLRSFSANVLSCRQVNDRWAVTLDRTAFYPEGGGQPPDLGTLDTVRVVDTKNQDGCIVHLCDGPLAVGQTVEGRVDWDRRFDFMQQHSGEHIVSGFLCGNYHCDNVGFHIGHDLVTIDFNTELTWDQVWEIEANANQYIWENHDVEISFPSPAELELLDYRSKKALSGQVRIVTWPGADCCACCGTHLRSSGQIGLVKIISCQKFREGVRIEMAAGKRAVAYCSAILEQNSRVSHLLSAKPGETADAVERLKDQLFTLQGRLTQLEDDSFAQKAQSLSGAGDVTLFEAPMSPESLRKLCTAVANACGGRCAVFSGDNCSYQYAISIQNGDLRPFVKTLNAALHGHGGGKPGFVQGRVEASKNEITAFFNL